MNKIITLIIFFFTITAGHLLTQVIPKDFYTNHATFSEKSISSKRLKHYDVLKLINSLRSEKIFTVKKVGESINGKEINMITFGSGSVSVFCWSQMHGDESTATMALFDIFNFLKSDENKDFVKELSEKLTIYFVPMLNPDGSDAFTRRNLLNIDLNRDAERLQSPEAKLLRGLQDSIKPVFGFNLHDQSIHYAAGRTQHPATISFLAPAYNYEKEMNEVRTNTMQLIGGLYKHLSSYIPGHIGRYSDDFEPRAFGDNFVKWGTSSVLIESGGWKNDTEKQFIRRLNYTALLSGFYMIANNIYENYTVEDYNSIPENDRSLFDLLLRKATYNLNGNDYIIDIGIIRDEKNTDDKRSYYFSSRIDDVGDLSTYEAYNELNCEGFTLVEGKIYDKVFDSFSDITEGIALELLKKGYTGAYCEELPENPFVRLPINLYAAKHKKDIKFSLNSAANLLLYRDKKLFYVIVNGFIFDLKVNKSNIINTLIFP